MSVGLKVNSEVEGLGSVVKVLDSSGRTDHLDALIVGEIRRG